MNLTLRRQPLNFPHDDPDLRWSVFCEGWSIGVIIQYQGRADAPRTWQWVMHLHAGRFTNGMAAMMSGERATREEAMSAFREAWDVVRPALTDEGWALHVEHMQWLAAQTARHHRHGAGTDALGNG